MNRTTGTWDPADRHAYFLAGGRPQVGQVPHDFVLVAVNELCDPAGQVKPSELERVDALLDQGYRVVMDSGVFWLTNEHKRAHGISMDEALALAPDEIDNFDWLWASYLKVFETWGERLWGYIELDQGGAVNKRLTRARLHDAGITPMPVYHPINDGWDYFDEIASTHDRMCCGNIVQAMSPLRLRLLHTISERHRAYPDLWIHFLGYTPNQWVNACPVDGCDSSSWLTSIRWSAAAPCDIAMGSTFEKLPPAYWYRLGSKANDADGSNKSALLAAAGVEFHNIGWRDWMGRLRAEFPDLPAYPASGPDQDRLLARHGGAS